MNSNKKEVPKVKILSGWVILLGLWFFLRSLVSNSSIFLVSGEMIKSVLINLSAIIQLIGKSFLPFNLSVLPIIQDTSFVYGIIAVILLAVLFYFKKNKRWNYILFGLVWFLLFLLPSFLKLNPGSVVDFIEHRLYLPIIGLFIIVLELNPIKDWRKNKIYYHSFLSVIALFCCMTFFHSFNFSDKFEFWENAVENSPHHPLAHRNLGAMYYLEGDFENAEREFKESLRINPNEEMAHNNLGLVYFQQNKLIEAEKEYQKEIKINPFYDNVHYNLGLLYLKEGKINEAEIYFKKALGINPNKLDVVYSLFNLYYEKKDYENASIYANELHKKGIYLPVSVLFDLQ
ncbi:tetratricopeptide repeat protein [Patescibacteria group bacterium]|nr:tetratricopeptide repeat protein [Patescibacteria group bacterium]